MDSSFTDRTLVSYITVFQINATCASSFGLERSSDLSAPAQLTYLEFQILQIQGYDTLIHFIIVGGLIITFVEMDPSCFAREFYQAA